MLYRFKISTFVKAESFEEAKEKMISNIKEQEEDPKAWHKCACLGFSHSFSCPYHPLNTSEIPFK